MTTKEEYKELDDRCDMFIKNHKAGKKNIGLILILDKKGWMDISSINTESLLDFIHDWERWVLNILTRKKKLN